MGPIRWKALCVLVTLLTLVGCDKKECQTDADCNDSNACTTDVCRKSVCVRETVAVDDGNRCTVDSCDPSAGPQHSPVAVDDQNQCTADSCDPATGQAVHTPVSVDDGNACTTDACTPSTGAITHSPVAVDDGNACTADACNPTTGVSHTPVSSDDGNACTTDSCDPSTGVHHEDVAVDDGNACTLDSCSPATGVAHVEISPDDGNVCTTDSCDPATGARHDAVAVDDSNACTTDSCHPTEGVQHTQVAVDDNNVCTTDSCDPDTGIQHAQIPVDDNNVCTTDSCDPVNGPQHAQIPVDDSNVCTMDACDPKDGVSHVEISTDDNDVCTTDACDPETGASHTLVNTDDSNVCTTDSCHPTEGVQHTQVAVDDNNVCTADACDPVKGVSHTLVSTDDGNACTADSCDPDTGIQHTEVAVDDNNVCTTDSCNVETGVHHDAVPTDDNIPCTQDACDPASGVSHTPVHSRCELDGFSCTVAVCSTSTGCSESVDNARCSDGASCTADACVGAGGAAGTGCRNTPNDTLCQPLQVCTSGGCTSASSADQVGNIVITEFSALGSEFIELRNTSALEVDVRGFVFQNLAGQLAEIRAKTDVNGSAGTPVTLPAGGIAYGVANPSSGNIPASAAFVYGDVGTSFSLNDSGDVIAIHSRNGATLQDYVDFRSFITDANVPMVANAFPGFLGVSTQVEPASASATSNDSGNNWCTTFYPASGPKAKVSNTAGAPNGSCKIAVINEALIDPPSTDDGLGFLEIVGPGGALVGGAKVEDVEGKGTTVGARNAGSTTDVNGTDPGGELTLPTGWRIPADGVLIIADGVNGTASGSYTASKVAGLGAGDLTVRDMDLENSGGDSIILVAPDGTVWDVLGHEGSGAPLDRGLTTFTINGSALPMVEGSTAITPTDNVGYSMCRDSLSTDSDNNSKDFRVCFTPSPGQANSVGTTTITSISLNNTLASPTATTANVVITGTEFASTAAVKFGATVASCSVPAGTGSVTTQFTCTVPANATVGRVDVSVKNPLRAGDAVATLAQAFTYTGVLNGTANPQEADYCNLQFPLSITATANTATDLIYGRLYEAGLTESSGAPSGVTAQVGYGPSASNPTSVTTWRYFNAVYNVQVGNDDEFQASFTAPAAGTYSYAYRFSLDGGLNWTYCDKDGAGSGSGLGFSNTQLGTLTVQ